MPVSDALAIHTADGIHTLTPTGNATIPYQLQQQTQQAGLSGRSILTVPGNKQFFVQEEGVYEWDGNTEVTKASVNLDDGYWSRLNEAKLNNTFAVLPFKQRIMVLASVWGHPSQHERYNGLQP